jgi:hypothetical protein
VKAVEKLHRIAARRNVVAQIDIGTVRLRHREGSNIREMRRCSRRSFVGS